MELSDIHIFRTVVRTGGILRAAEALHRVPSNITMRVKALEDKLGVVLFLRENRRMQLTPAGKILLEYADRLLDLAEEANNALHETEPIGKLLLGAMESTAAVRLPTPLAAFHAAYPDVSLELHTGDPRHLISQVLTGALDVALVAEPVSDPRLGTMVMYEEELVIVADARHPPIKSSKQVKGSTLLAFHPGCPHRQRLEDWFIRGGATPERIVEVTSYHTILGCVVAGMGIALIPYSVLTTYMERPKLSVHKLSGKFRSARTLLIWRKESMQAKIVALTDILLSHRRKIAIP
jgi:DNA-binding transcriptional LysR family regulator